MTLACEATKPGHKASWYCNGKLIKTDENKGIHIEIKGTRHTLTIHKASLSDANEYTVKIGSQECSAQLMVDGKSNGMILLKTVDSLKNMMFLRLAKIPLFLSTHFNVTLLQIY